MSGINIWGGGDNSGFSVTSDELKTKVSRSGDLMTGILDMNNNKIRNVSYPLLSTDAATKLYVDNGYDEKVSLIGDIMTGNLVLKVNTDNVRVLGCNDLSGGKEFNLLLGNFQNQIQYEVQNIAPQPVKLLSNNGFLIKLNNNDIIRFGSSGTDLRINCFKDLLMNRCFIANLRDPNSPQDAATKNYVDTTKKKCHCGYIPNIISNANRSAFIASASSEYSSVI